MFAANAEIFLTVRTLPQLGQMASCTPVMRINFSKFSLQSWHSYSYSGIGELRSIDLALIGGDIHSSNLE